MVREETEDVGPAMSFIDQMKLGALCHMCLRLVD